MKNEPGDHVVFRTQNRGDGKKTVEVHTPEMVLPIYNKEELEAQISHYARTLMSLTTSDTQSARRKYVELIRPALRYYCKKFSVKAPDWLQSDDLYTKTMSPNERQRHFGMAPLRVGEFQKIKPVEGIESVDYPGKQKPPAEGKTNGKPQSH